MDARRKTGEYAAWVLAALCLIAGGVLEGLGHAFALAWGLGGALVLTAVLALRRGAERREALERADALRDQLEREKAEAARALERAGRAHRDEMEAFRSDLSHSLRMSISIVQGYAELLADGVVEDGEARLWDTCNYFLAVYQGEGLAYYREYLNSLYTAGQDLESYEYACRSLYTTPLELAWAENP